MSRPLVLLSILATLAAADAFAKPALDAAGKCRDNGRFVDAKLCATPAPGEKCRDSRTKKFARCGTPGTEPVPAR